MIPSCYHKLRIPMDSTKVIAKKRRKKDAADRWKALSKSDEFWDQFLAELSEHGRLKAHLSKYGIPWSLYYRHIKNMPERHEQVQAALEAAGHGFAERSMDALDEFDMSDPKFARIKLEQLNWLAVKYAPKQFSDRQRIELQTTDMTRLHLEAVKELALQPKDITPKRKELHHDPQIDQRATERDSEADEEES